MVMYERTFSIENHIFSSDIICFEVKGRNLVKQVLKELGIKARFIRVFALKSDPSCNYLAHWIRIKNRDLDKVHKAMEMLVNKALIVDGEKYVEFCSGILDAYR